MRFCRSAWPCAFSASFGFIFLLTRFFNETSIMVAPRALQLPRPELRRHQESEPSGFRSHTPVRKVLPGSVDVVSPIVYRRVLAGVWEGSAFPEFRARSNHRRYRLCGAARGGRSRCRTNKPERCGRTGRSNSTLLQCSSRRRRRQRRDCCILLPLEDRMGGRDACEKKQSGNGRSLSGITHLLIRSDPPRSELERRLAVEFDSKEQLKEEWVEVTSTKKVTTREKVLIDLRYASCGT